MKGWIFLDFFKKENFMAQEKIIIKGAREHNLKNINLELPRNQLIVFSGLSGSGKSSLAFDTIFAEGQRRYVESLSAYARQFLGKMDKPDVDEIEGLSPAISIDQKAHSANPRSTVATLTEIYDYLRILFARVGKPYCPKCHQPIRRLSVGEMIEKVLSRLKEILEYNIQAGEKKDVFSLKEIWVLAPLVRGRKGEYFQLLNNLYNDGFTHVRIDGKFYDLRQQIKLKRYHQHSIDVLMDKVPLGWPLENNKNFQKHLYEAIELALAKSQGLVTIILFNENKAQESQEMTFSAKFFCPNDGFSFPEIEPRLFSFNSPYGYCPACTGLGTRDLFSEEECPLCHGARLRQESLHIFIEDLNIYDFIRMTIEEAYNFIEKKFIKKEFSENISIKGPLDEKDILISQAVVREIVSRLKFMLDVGLNYLTLDRKAGSLSGGEAQRIRLASQLGSRLTGTLYVLDEPTIGLHPEDNAKLIKTLKELTSLGNTVIVVEHDEETIRASDYLVDLGPGAGRQGGEVVVAGPTNFLLEKKNFSQPVFQKNANLDIVGDPKKSLTLAYLWGDKTISRSPFRQPPKEKLKIIKAEENNLKKINVEIPLKRFVCLTGVSGSGKSTLLYEIIYKALANHFYGTRYIVGKHQTILGKEYLKRVVLIDQSPIGRTPRSNPATYTGLWGPIRELFASLPESKMRGYKASRFSFNVPSVTVGGAGGRCENCQGQGQIAVEMHFLPTVWITCDICHGQRFDQETLEIRYKGKNIFEVLNLTIVEALDFFRDIPNIYEKLKILNEVGLGYLQLGQSATTLSGGEAQRVKLAAELVKKSSSTLYLLDEPTVGLHYEDVRNLISVLQALVNAQNTVVVIEHNFDLVKCADWIIDLGPGGGEKGGEIVGVGTPEDIARKNTPTGRYLRKIIYG